MENNYAVAYCRVSTDEQANKGLSLDVQEEACKTAIESDGFNLLEIIRDEGKSAGTLKRPGIEKIIGLVTDKKICAVYSISSDRLARNTMDYLYLRDLLRKNGVELRYVYQPIGDDSAASRTMDTVMASFNEFQRLTISEKVKKTLKAKAEAGYFPSFAPLGYINISNPDPSARRIAQKILVPCPKSSELIKEAFELYSTGNYNVYDLNDILYEKGLRSKKGIKLSASMLYEILKNRIYIGEIHWGVTHIENGKHEPLVGKEIFDRTQSILANNNKHTRRRRKHTWLLNGFVYCGKHQKRFTAEWHLNKNKAYYHCSNKHGCGKYIEKTDLEMEIAGKFKNLEFNEKFTNLVMEKVKTIYYERRSVYDKKRQSLINQRTGLEIKRRTLEEKLLNSVISDEEFSRIKNRIVTEIQNIDDRIQNLEANQEIKTDLIQDILGFTRSIYRTYISAPEPIKRLYLGLFWDRFEIQDGVITKSVPSLLFKELVDLEQVYYKDPKNQKYPDLLGNKKVILSHNLLPG